MTNEKHRERAEGIVKAHLGPGGYVDQAIHPPKPTLVELIVQGLTAVEAAALKSAAGQVRARCFMRPAEHDDYCMWHELADRIESGKGDE